MKLSELFEAAINNSLSESGERVDGKEYFSCDAVLSECQTITQTRQAYKYLVSLGLDMRSYEAFSEFPEGRKRQRARALWLTWAAMIAKEEGL